MLTGKRLLKITVLVFILASLSTYSYAKKSVYVISDTGSSEFDVPVLQAYEIQGTSLSLPFEYECVHPLAIGIAIDDYNREQFLFITHEDEGTTGGDRIEIVNAKTMKYVDTVIAQGADNLAGITVDTGKSKLYAVDRYSNHLYSWSWNPETMNLTPDFNEPYYIELFGLTYGYPNYDERCDLYVDEYINGSDLELFCEDWLWGAGWRYGWMYEEPAAGAGYQMPMCSSGFIVYEKASFEPAVSLTLDEFVDCLEWIDKVELESRDAGLITGDDFKKFRDSIKAELFTLLETKEK